MSTKSFVQNVNKCAENLDALLELNSKLPDEYVSALKTMSNLVLPVLINDINKGTYMGKRQIKFDLVKNLSGYSENLTTEELTALWSKLDARPKYHAIQVFLKDGTTRRVEFEQDGNPIFITTNEELYSYLSTNIDNDNPTGTLKFIENSSVTTEPETVGGYTVVVSDAIDSIVDSSVSPTSGLNMVFSNVISITLDCRVATGSGGFTKNLNANYDMYGFGFSDATSSLEFLTSYFDVVLDLFLHLDDIIDAPLIINDLKTVIESIQADIVEIQNDIIERQEDVTTKTEAVQVVYDNAVVLDAHIEQNKVVIETLNSQITKLAEEVVDNTNTVQSIANQMFSLSVGDVTVTPEGTDPDVEYNPTLNTLEFSLPKGIQGDKGDTGFGFSLYATYDTLFEAYANVDVIPPNSLVLVLETLFVYLVIDDDPESPELLFVQLFQLKDTNVLRGEKGDQGIQGPKGDQGKDGASLVIHNSFKSIEEMNDALSITPIGSLVIIGNEASVDNGDMYLRSVDSFEFVFTIGSVVSTIKGEKGDTGEQGVQGERGERFFIDVSDVYASIGLYNDEPKGFTFFAIDTNKVYMKMSDVSANWSVGIDLIQGPQGEKGDTGAAGADGEKGEKGDNGLALPVGVISCGSAVSELAMILDGGNASTEL